MSNQIKALNWIVGKLADYGITYQVVGGLAAIAYGSTRPLADIDLYISYKASKAFLDDLKEYIYWGPGLQKDEHWDIVYLKINYEGQKIEIGDSNHAKIFNTQTNTWISQEIDYNASEQKTVYGCLIAVMPLNQLITYKAALNRDVDKLDIRQIKNRL